MVNRSYTASISPTTSGSYTVQVTNAAGCQSASSAATVVTVNALPATPTISAGGPLTFCAGGSVTLNFQCRYYLFMVYQCNISKYQPDNFRKLYGPGDQCSRMPERFISSYCGNGECLT